MADVPSQTDLFAAGRRQAILQPTRFDVSIIDTEGSDVNVVFNIGGAQGEEVAQFFQAAFNELSLSTARGDALDRWVFDRYQLTRFEPTSAVAVLRLTRTNTFPVTIPAGSSFADDSGFVFQSIVDVVFGAGVVGPLEVSAVAQETGELGNVAADTIRTVSSTFGDSSVVVTNPEPAAGGRAQETDDQLRERARAFFVNARRGTRSAIEFGGLSVDRVAQATAIELFAPETSLPGYRVFLNIADVAGQANAALATEVRDELDEFRALGVPVSVVPAVPQYVTVRVVGLAFEAGANTVEVLSRARGAILAAINATAPGVTLRRAAIVSALEGTDQLIVPDGAVVEPAGDVVPTTGTIIRARADTITLNGT